MTAITLPVSEPSDARQTAEPPTLGKNRLWRRSARRCPHIQQHDATDCAAACLAMVAAGYGVRVGMARLRDLANVDANGATFWSVARAAEALGFHARGLRLDFEALRELHLPAIVHWEGFHYVVLQEVGPRHVVVDDPAMGRRRLSRETFLAGWTRLALEFVPSTQLTRTGALTCVWRRFLPLLRPHGLMILEVLASSLLLSLLGLSVPVFTQMVVDRVLVNRSVDLLNMLLIAMVLMAGFQGAMRGVRQVILVHVSIRFDARLLGDFFRHLFRLPQRFFDVRRVGDVTSRVAENERIRQALTSTLPGVLLDASLALGYLALLAAYSTRLTFVVLAVLPFLAGLLWVFTPLMRRLEKERFARHTEAATYLIEAASGIATVKAFAVESQVRGRMESLFINSLLAARRSAHVSTAYSLLAVLAQSLSIVALLAYGARQVLAGELTAGELLAFVTIAGNVITPILGIVVAWDRLQEAANAAERLADIFECEVEQAGGGELPVPTRLEGRIQLEDVSFNYTGDDDEPLLDGLELEIQPGETVAIVGRSGSGKTTLLKLLLGLYAPTRGHVLVDGHDLRSISLPALRRRVGMVPQDVFLFSGSIRENITLANPDMPWESLVQAARLAGTHEFVSHMPLGYETRVGERGQSLSGGQRQRIALARALASDPDILLLDEATSALDALSEDEIRGMLDNITHGRTTVIVAHRLSTVRGADRILVLDGGKIIDQGTHDQLMRRCGLYMSLVGQQIEG